MQQLLVTLGLLLICSSLGGVPARTSHPGHPAPTNKVGGNIAAAWGRGKKGKKPFTAFKAPNWGHLFRNRKRPSWFNKRPDHDCQAQKDCGPFAFCHVQDSLHHKPHCKPCLAMMQKQCLTGKESVDGKCEKCTQPYAHFHPPPCQPGPGGLDCKHAKGGIAFPHLPRFDLSHMNATYWQKQREAADKRRKEHEQANQHLMESAQKNAAALQKLEAERAAQHIKAAAAARGDDMALKEAHESMKRVDQMSKEWKSEEQRIKDEEKRLKKEEADMQKEEAQWSKYKEELAEMSQWESMMKNEEKVLEQYETVEKEEMTGVWVVLGVIVFGFLVCFYCCCISNTFKEYIFEKIIEYERMKAQGGQYRRADPGLVEMSSRMGGRHGGGGDFEIGLEDVEDG